MSEVTTIQLEKKIVEKLKKSKEYPRQTYNELLEQMVLVFAKMKKRKRQYDEFLHYAQQPAMKKLWDNKEDEAWDSV